MLVVLYLILGYNLSVFNTLENVLTIKFGWNPKEASSFVIIIT